MELCLVDGLPTYSAITSRMAKGVIEDVRGKDWLESPSLSVGKDLGAMELDNERWKLSRAICGLL